MTTNRIRIFASALATAVFGLTTASAHAYFDFDTTPDVPGVGEPRGVYGPGPEVQVGGGRIDLFRGRLVPVAVECVTSTEAGCTGVLKLTDQAGRRASARFDLDEGQAWRVFVDLPADARRLVRLRAGWKATATATVTDSLARSATDSIALSVRSRRR